MSTINTLSLERVHYTGLVNKTDYCNAKGSSGTVLGFISPPATVTKLTLNLTATHFYHSSMTHKWTIMLHKSFEVSKYFSNWGRKHSRIYDKLCISCKKLGMKIVTSSSLTALVFRREADGEMKASVVLSERACRKPRSRGKRYSFDRVRVVLWAARPHTFKRNSAAVSIRKEKRNSFVVSLVIRVCICYFYPHKIFLHLLL